jgi:hypothetical protein
MYIFKYKKSFILSKKAVSYNKSVSIINIGLQALFFLANLTPV